MCQQTAQVQIMGRFGNYVPPSPERSGGLSFASLPRTRQPVELLRQRPQHPRRP
jgi:hypothetical protein